MVKKILFLLTAAAIALFLIVRIALADTDGPNSPATTVDDSTVGTVTWTTPNNSQGQDDTFASAELGDGFGGSTTSHYIKATNFSMSITADSTIDGIVVEVDRHESDAGDNIFDNTVRIVKGNTIGSTDRADSTEWQVGDDDTYFSYGSSSDLWGETWTVADIEADDFGFAISARGGGEGLPAPPGQTHVDHIRITVHFTAPGGAPAADESDWIKGQASSTSEWIKGGSVGTSKWIK